MVSFVLHITSQVEHTKDHSSSNVNHVTILSKFFSYKLEYIAKWYNLLLTVSSLKTLPYSRKVWWGKVWQIDSLEALGKKSLAN